jgi:predicted dehydrogenase
MGQGSIGVAVIGTGFGQKVHIPALQIHHRTEVVAVYHRDRNRAQAIAEQHQIPHASDDLAEILALDAVQAVTIATPPFLHFEMTCEAIKAGKHVLLEKPMALDETEAQHLYKLAQQHAVAAVMDFEFRFIPAWQYLAELLRENYVGQIRLIKIDWLASSRASADRHWNWYAQKDLGGGALGAIGSHLFDYIAWLFGPIERLCAHMSTSIPMRFDPIAQIDKTVDADDTCHLLLELQGGIPCQVALSSVTYAGRGHWLEIYGDQGTLVLGSANQSDYVHGFELWAAKAGEPLAPLPIPDSLDFPQVYPDGRLAPFIRVVNHWVTCIDNGTHSGSASVPSFAEGLYSQRLMDLTHESHEKRAWVNVPSY